MEIGCNAFVTCWVRIAGAHAMVFSFVGADCLRPPRAIHMRL